MQEGRSRIVGESGENDDDDPSSSLLILDTYDCSGIRFVVPRRYRITQIIARLRGDSAIVLATDTVSHREVDIKKIPLAELAAEKAGSDDDGKSLTHQKRVLRELLTMNHLRNHENVIHLSDVLPPPSFSDFTDVYIVTEHSDSDFRAVFNSPQPLTNLNVQYFVYQMLRGMKYVSSANIVHRFLSPRKFQITSDMDVKVSGFDLARGISWTQDPTQSTTYVSSRWYRAPENLLMWDRVSKTVDVWSVGLIFAEMLMPRGKRHPLLRGKNYLHQIELVLDLCGTPPPDQIRGCAKAKAYVLRLPVREKTNLQERFPTADPLALDLLDKMLQMDPIQRISFEQALEHPYLEIMHDADDEPSCAPFEFRMPQMRNAVTKHMIKRMIFDFVMAWNRAVHEVTGPEKIVVSPNVIFVRPRELMEELERVSFLLLMPGEEEVVSHCRAKKNVQIVLPGVTLNTFRSGLLMLML